MLARRAPRIATSGALTIGVKFVPPMPPRLEIENVPPWMSAGVMRPSRIRAETDGEFLAEFQNAFAIDVLDNRHDETVRRVDGDAEIVVFLQDQRILWQAPATH